MPRAYIGLGSNLQDPVAQILNAKAALMQLPESRFVAISPLYRNPPFGSVPQPAFVNAVAGLDTELPGFELLAALQLIEAAQGRQRSAQRWGPRTLDLDILLYGEIVINHPQLQVPHPGLSERNFVLYPLHDIVPTLVIPGFGPLSELLQHCSAEGLERLEPI